MLDSGLCDWLVPPLLLPTPIMFSLDRKRWSTESRRGSDSVELMTPLTTDFRLSRNRKRSDLTSLTTTSDSVLVKTSLKGVQPPNVNSGSFRTVPTIVSAHTFCASRKTWF